MATHNNCSGRPATAAVGEDAIHKKERCGQGTLSVAPAVRPGDLSNRAPEARKAERLIRIILRPYGAGSRWI